MMSQHQEDFTNFIADIRLIVIKDYPLQVDYFEIFVNEAKFGLSIIEEDLNCLPQGASILEIGAGLYLISGYLFTKGFRIHALEPLSAGFSHFREIQTVIVKYYERKGFSINLIESRIEDYSNNGCFDYIFSINAIEHIQNVELGLSNAYLSLRKQGRLRVYCPNYYFPYEPHFNIPTLFSKKLTELLFKTSIYNSKHVIEAKDTWEALNWINVIQVRRLFINTFGVYPIFNKHATFKILDRMFTDAQFRKRRSGWIKLLLIGMEKIGLVQLSKYCPVIASPVMDFHVNYAEHSPE